MVQIMQVPMMEILNYKRREFDGYLRIESDFRTNSIIMLFTCWFVTWRCVQKLTMDMPYLLMMTFYWGCVLSSQHWQSWLIIEHWFLFWCWVIVLLSSLTFWLMIKVNLILNSWLSDHSEMKMINNHNNNVEHTRYTGY